VEVAVEMGQKAFCAGAIVGRGLGKVVVKSCGHQRNVDNG
jgi:hypothetical protein